MPNNKFLTGCVLTGALLGCGGVTGIPIEKTATDFAQTICSQAYSCCTMATRMNNMAAGTTEPECEMKTAQNFRNQLQTMQAAENAGRAKYDQVQVDACLAAIRAASCTTLTSIYNLKGLPECDSTFATPLVELGGACQQDFECINSVCVQGVCAAGASTGASCVSGAKCGPDLLCDPRDGSNMTDDVCVVEQDNGGPCVDNFDCKSRLCSASGTGGAKTCMAQTAAQCFYGGGCSAAGGRPGVATLLLMAAFVAVALLRSRRAARSRR